MSGQKMIKMDALRKMYEDLGYKNIQTYIQSGNVIFQCKKSKQNDLAKKISTQIAKQFGFEVPVIVMEVRELKEIILNNPFLNDHLKDLSHLHVTFLSSTPDSVNFENIKQGQPQGEKIALIGKTIYLYCPNGYGKTKFTNTWLENKLKVNATTRNWKTTNELLYIATEITNNNSESIH